MTIPETLAKFRRKPSLFVPWAFGIQPYPMQSEIMDCFSADNPRAQVAVAAYRGWGKTALQAFVHLFFQVVWQAATVVTFSATWLQVRTIQWPELAKWWAVAAARGKRLTDEPPKTTEWKPAPGALSVGCSPKEPGKIEGYHAKRIMTIGDECRSVDDAVYNATLGYKSKAEVCQFLACSVPGVDRGWFYTRKASSDWIPKRVNGEEDPNCDKAWIAECAREWGRESALYQSQVCANSYSGSDFGLCDPAWLDLARRGGRDVDATGDVEVGADVGAGGDLSAYIARRGGLVLEAASQQKRDTMQTVGEIVNFFERNDGRCGRIDGVGIGKGPYDRLRELKFPFESYNAGADARDKEHFRNRRAEDFWGLRTRFEEGRIDLSRISPDFYARLERQLCSLQHHRNSSGQVEIQTKDEYKRDMRKKYGPGHDRSPDEADALAMAFAVDRFLPVVYRSSPGVGGVKRE